MAEQKLHVDLESLLEALELNQFYPEKLTHHDLHQITKDGLQPEQRRKCSPAWQFIYNITRYNYHARNVKYSEEYPVTRYKMGFRERSRRQREDSCAQSHPLDILVAVFLCCDPAAKQDLITHLWRCKLAVPFAVCLEQDKVHLFCWPIRSLIEQFQVDGKFVENQLIQESMKCMAFLRVGENEKYSKSYIMNCLIGGSEKPHPIFFHRNLEGSKKSRSSVTNGLIELAWSLPSEALNAKPKDPRLFVNLRGDAEKLHDQVLLIGQMATVSFLLCTLQSLKNTKKVVNSILQNGSNVLIIVTDEDPDLDVISEFLDTWFPDIPETKLDIITSERLVLSEFLGAILHNLDKMESNKTKKIVISDFVNNLSKTHFCVDERSEVFSTPFEYSSKIVASIQAVPAKERKKRLLYLQDEYWKKWSMLDRDLFRFDQLDKEDKKKYGSKKALAQKMKVIRKSQYKHFAKSGISKPVAMFIEAVSTLSRIGRKVFIRMLKLELDKMSHDYMRPIYDQYQELLHQTVSAKEEERIEINRQLSELDEAKSDLSFGVEHIIREIGQLFEACESHPDENVEIMKIRGQMLSYKMLPRYICYLLLDGLPIEILDGEACSVPLLWIRQLFSEMPHVMRRTGLVEKSLGDINVHTISVLGIQSSGKSTFLNTIFGLQFAVSAGRCTRGAFMQLIKVHSSLAKELETDFVLAIDTEGLKAAELISNESVKHDNELSTFVIGLADTTVINLMGENATYLQENLPIAVHAFLRMNLVGLHPRCTIVHHNVDKQNKEKLLQQGRILESVLNKLTAKACEVENIPPRLFHDLIEFSIANHTDYIPALFEGEQPMAPINVGYSMDSDSVRTKLINFVYSEVRTEKTTLSYFVQHLDRLWCAIKKDRFVYEFRTTLETEAKLELEKAYSKIVKDFLSQVDELALKCISLLKNKRYPLSSVKSMFVNDVESMESSARESLEIFVGKPKKIASGIYDQWKDHYMKNLEDEIKSSRESSVEQFENCWTQLKPIPMENFEAFFNLMQKESAPDLNTSFTIAWSKWAQQFGIQGDEDLILTHTTVALQEVCPSHKHLLEEARVEQSSFSSFKPSLMHLNHLFYNFSQSEIDTLLAKLQRFCCRMHDLYRLEIAKIVTRKIPYTYRTPKRILLMINDIVSTWLAANESREFSNIFKVDILLSAAGSIVKDLYVIVQENSLCDFLKREMMSLTFKKVRNSQRAAKTVIDILIFTVESILFSQEYSVVQACVLRAFKLSDMIQCYRSKQSLLASLLFAVIRHDDDKLLNEYVSSPEIAMHTFTKALLLNLIKNRDFTNEVVTAIRSQTKELLSCVNSLKESEDTVSKIINVIAKCDTVSVDTVMMLQAKCKNIGQRSVYLPQLKAEFPKKFEKYLKRWTELLASKCTEGITLDACSSTILNPVIGCKEMCPFCREICQYSYNHPGNHECLSHRPVGLLGWHWKETEQMACEPCNEHYELNTVFCYNEKRFHFQEYGQIYKDWQIRGPTQERDLVVWKWIFVNKYNVLENAEDLQLPRNLPEDWKCITRKETLRALLAFLD